jgi:8-oxo-dGTP diphosphatase
VSRRFPERPVASVGAVVIGAEGVLLVRRGQPPLAGEWSLPGGAVEVGETMVDAVRREVREETGVEVEVGPLLDAFDRIYHDADGRVEFHYLLVDFACTPSGGELCCGSDAAAARWVAIDDLPNYSLTPLALGVIAKGLELRRPPV